MVSSQKALTKVFGDPQQRILKRLQKKVVLINNLADSYKKLNKKIVPAVDAYQPPMISNKKHCEKQCFLFCLDDEVLSFY